MRKDSQQKSGRTTRIADALIQRIYSEAGIWIPCYDHTREWSDNLRLAILIESRLRAEHPSDNIQREDISIRYMPPSVRVGAKKRFTEEEIDAMSYDELLKYGLLK